MTLIKASKGVNFGAPGLVLFKKKYKYVIFGMMICNFWSSWQQVIFYILFNLHFFRLGAMPENIGDQARQHNLDWNTKLEYCVDQKNPIKCIRDNLRKTGTNSKTVNEVIDWNSVLENCDDPKNMVYCLIHCNDQKDPANCFRENFNHFEKKTENVFMKIYSKTCVRDNQCSFNGKILLFLMSLV